MPATELEPIRSKLGAAAVLEGNVTGQYAIGGVTPRAVVRPASAEEVAAVVRWAMENGRRLIPYGSGSKQSWGPWPEDVDVVVDTARLNRFTSLEPGNLTMNVMAGATLSQVQAWAQEAGLWFPVEFVEAPRATLGGTLAAGVTGPRRLAYGPARNWVLGLELVTGRGDIVHTGAATVKNVAGYDLTRLQVGAWGTLGIITSATIRLVSRPAGRVSVEAHYKTAAEAIEAALALARSPAAPAAVEVMDHGAVQAVAGMRDFGVAPDEFVLMAMFEGDPESLDDRRREAERALAGAAAVRLLDPSTQATAWAARYALAPRVQKAWGKVLRLNVAVPAARWADAYELAAGVMGRVGPLAAGGHAANGIVDFYVGLGGMPSREAVGQAVSELRRGIEDMQGHVEVRWAPREIGTALPWYGERATRDLEAALARVFDPAGVFNPHRRV